MRAFSGPGFVDHRWRRGDGFAAGVALTAYLGLGWRSRRRVGRAERGLFAKFNHRSQGSAVLRIPQQLGTPWVLPMLSLLGLVAGRRGLALGAAVAVPLEKGLEVGVKKVLDRPRPAQVDQRSELHDDAPAHGPSYPSGHAAIAFTAVVLCSGYLPAPLSAAGFVMATTGSVVRVRQGAHFPGDAVGGALLGIGVACTLRSLLAHYAAGDTDFLASGFDAQP